MKEEIRILIGYLLTIAVFAGALLVTVWPANYMVSITKALECPQNDITTFELHPVTFVIVDTQSHPLADMRVRIACIKKSTHNYTTKDGSCSFLLEGSTKHTIIIENVHLEREKEFVVYPIQSCYLIVLETEKGRR